jgi:anti-sigma-K factor RskA
MTDFLQDQAALYALGLLDPEEARALEQLIPSDPALATLVRDLQDTLATTTRALPAATPPPALRAQLLDQIRLRKNQAPSRPKPLRSTSSTAWSRLAWGLAAAFAVTSSWLYTERTRLTDSLSVLASNEAAARLDANNFLARANIQQSRADIAEASASRTRQEADSLKSSLTQLTTDLQTLQQRNALAQMQIATLQSTVTEFQQGVAVVVWDSEKEQGILKLEKMPPIAADKDYQLWVVDPTKPKTVDAGIVRVDANGFARVEFKPVVDISEAAKFAVSIERKGGVPENEGPVILVGP